MKFPRHILLDHNENNSFSSSPYWIYRYLSNSANRFIELQNFKRLFHILYTPSTNFWNKSNFRLSSKYTLNYNYSKSPLIFSSSCEKERVSKFINKKYPINNKLEWTWSSKKWKFDSFFFPSKLLKKMKFKKHFKTYFTRKQIIFKDYKLWDLFDINFLRKEPLYTKLKYSRTPQYDIISGGSAALLSSFLGFLICERFGFELLDSGDFYYFFMYVVFLAFFSRILFKHLTTEKLLWNIFSWKWACNFYYLVLNNLTTYFYCLFWKKKY